MRPEGTTAPSITAPTQLGTTWAILWRIAVFFVGWGLIAAPLFVIAGGQFERWNETNPDLMRLCGDGWVALSILAVTWLMSRFIDRKPLRAAGITIANAPRDFAGGLVIGIVWLAVPLAVVWLAGWTTTADNGRFPWNDIPLAALALLVNVIAQQLLLTGYLFAMIRARAGLIPAVAVSATLFCAYHAAAFQGHLLPAMNVFLTAVFFCLAREFMGSFWLPAGAHAAWNFMLGPVLGLTVSGNAKLGEGWSAFQIGGPAWATGGSFGVEGGAIVSATTALLIGAALYALNRRAALLARS